MEWFEYPAEKKGIRIYRYYFTGVEAPISIEASNKAVSRTTLFEIMPQLPEKYRTGHIAGETVTIPLPGVTTKKEKGETFVWVGTDKSETGWSKTDN